MRKYRIVYEKELYRIEYRRFLFWKPLTQIIHSEQVDLLFTNLFSLEEYLKEISHNHVEKKEDFCILFL